MRCALFVVLCDVFSVLRALCIVHYVHCALLVVGCALFEACWRLSDVSCPFFAEFCFSVLLVVGCCCGCVLVVVLLRVGCCVCERIPRCARGESMTHRGFACESVLNGFNRSQREVSPRPLPQQWPCRPQVGPHATSR